MKPLTPIQMPHPQRALQPFIEEQLLRMEFAAELETDNHLSVNIHTIVAEATNNKVNSIEPKLPQLDAIIEFLVRCAELFIDANYNYPSFKLFSSRYPLNSFFEKLAQTLHIDLWRIQFWSIFTTSPSMSQMRQDYLRAFLKPKLELQDFFYRQMSDIEKLAASYVNFREQELVCVYEEFYKLTQLLFSYRSFFQDAYKVETTYRTFIHRQPNRFNFFEELTLFLEAEPEVGVIFWSIFTNQIYNPFISPGDYLKSPHCHHMLALYQCFIRYFNPRRDTIRELGQSYLNHCKNCLLPSPDRLSFWAVDKRQKNYVAHHYQFRP